LNVEHRNFNLQTLSDATDMNLSLANWILKRTPEHILHPRIVSTTLDKEIPLSNGTFIPRRGYRFPEGACRKDLVIKRIREGFRFWDVGFGQDTELNAAIKDAIDSKIVRREELFVLGRLEICKDELEVRMDSILRSTSMEYLDLLMVPGPYSLEITVPRPCSVENEDDSKASDSMSRHQMIDGCIQIWKKLGNFEGKVKAFGLSIEVTKSELNDILQKIAVKPAVIEVTATLELPREEFLELCKQHSIHIISNIGSEEWLETQQHPNEVDEIIQKHCLSMRSVLLEWSCMLAFQMVF
jgi:diketogulonate reductase-like aldo/keto reductase